MSSSTFGKIFTTTTFGESHGPALGAVVDGVPAGLPLDTDVIQRDLNRRRPGRSTLTSSRKEVDQVELLSGVFEGLTTGAPVTLLIRNNDARPSDYEAIKDLYRPGHADFTWDKKFNGIRDFRGGGRASGRETVARVAAGAIARTLLATVGVEVIGATHSIAGIKAELETNDWSASKDHELRCPDLTAAEKMAEAIKSAHDDGDSVGGVIEVHATGVPIGLGEPVFDKLDARLGSALFSIGAVKGVEIGDGFAMANSRGSETNDEIEPPQQFTTNHSGGVLGGISNGATIVVRAAIKPTPSIAKPQMTVDRDGNAQKIEIRGRHDPCIVPRIVAVAEAMVCLVLADFLLIHRARQRV